MNDQTRLTIPDIHDEIRPGDTFRTAHAGVPAIFLGNYFDNFDDTIADMRATCK